MAWCDRYEFVKGNEQIFAAVPTGIRFGAGSFGEIGHDASALGLSPVTAFSDKVVAALEAMDAVRETLKKSGVDSARYAEARIEAADQSFLAASTFAREGDSEGYVPLTRGSVIDSCTAADHCANYPADFLAYVDTPSRREPTGAGPARAPQRLPHHPRHRRRRHRDRGLRPAGEARQNGGCVQAAAAVAGPHRPRWERHPPRQRGGGQRIRPAFPRA